MDFEHFLEKLKSLNVLGVLKIVFQPSSLAQNIFLSSPFWGLYVTQKKKNQSNNTIDPLSHQFIQLTLSKVSFARIKYKKYFKYNNWSISSLNFVRFT